MSPLVRCLQNERRIGRLTQPDGTRYCRERTEVVELKNVARMERTSSVENAVRGWSACTIAVERVSEILQFTTTQLCWPRLLKR